MNRQQGFLLFVLAVAAAASFLIVVPILEVVLMSIVLAYILYPLNQRLEPYLGVRATPIAVITIASILLLGPLLYVAAVLYSDLLDVADQQHDLDLPGLEAWIGDVTGLEVELMDLFERTGRQAVDVLFGDVASVVASVTYAGIGLATMVFLLYYLLRDGEAFVRWLHRTAPIDDRVAKRLTEQIDKTTYGVIMGHLFVASLQGLLAGLAFWVVGIPNVILWTFVMVVAALLPIVGAFLVWAPATGYLLLVDQIPEAVFLFIWGSIVVGLVDNWTRPILVDREAHLNPAVIIIGVIGGLYAIGATGLFVGPIIIGVLVAAMQVFDEEWDRLGRI